MITETNWDLWLMGFVLAWAVIELIGYIGRDGWTTEYPYDDDEM